MQLTRPRHTVSAHGKAFRLIDTPGFDDTPAANLGALRKIAERLNDPKRKVVVRGTIYFHSITNTRLSGSARSNIEIFEGICGGPFFCCAVFVTTMWNMVRDDKWRKKYEKLEAELQNNQLRHLSNYHITWSRFNATPGMALETLKLFAMMPQRPVELLLGKEIKELGASPSSVRKTTAGRSIVREMNRGRCVIL